MSADKQTISAQVNTDSDLWQQFTEYKEQRALPSKSATARELLKTGLNQHQSKNGDTTDSEETAESETKETNIGAFSLSRQGNAIELSPAVAVILAGLAYALPDWESALEFAFGGSANIIYASIGVILLVFVSVVTSLYLYEAAMQIVDLVRSQPDDATPGHAGES